MNTFLHADFVGRMRGVVEADTFERYQMYACDWIAPGSTHAEGVEACISGILGHEPRANPDHIRAAIAAHWGHCGREEDEDV